MNDYFNAIKNGNAKMPKLHGHIKVTTSYAMSGNIAEVVEADNIVTNALADIFSLDYMNGIDGSKMMPLWSKWFSGILMYENAFATSGTPAVIDPANYYPQDDETNHLFAHAGDTAPSDASDDTRRGSPNTIAQQVTDGMVKLAWEWGSGQGNSGDRYINSVALTHKDTGNCGLGSVSNAFASFQPFESIGNYSNFNTALTSAYNVFAQYDDNHGICYYKGEDGDFVNGKTKTPYTTITVYVKRFPYLKTGLIESMIPNTENQRMFTVDTPITWYCQPSYYFDATNKYLWLFTNVTGTSTYSNTTVKYCIIDCENEELVNLGTEQIPVYYKEIVSDTSNLAPVCMDCNWDGTSVACPYYTNVINDGTYVYFPTTSGNVNFGSCVFNVNGYKKIKISDTGVQSQIAYNTAQTHLQASMIGGGLILTSGRVINGSTGYNCASIFDTSSGGTSMCYVMNQPYNVSTYALPMGTYRQTSSRARYLLANKMVHTTMLNLPAAVQKTTAKNMNVEYVLTEA